MKPGYRTLACALVFGTIFAFAATGCFYPPTTKPAPPERDQMTLQVPFDLTWQAVHKVLADNSCKIIAEDPNNGIIETQAAGGFSVKEADCGKMRTLAAKYDAEPRPDSSAVYNFTVKPVGNESSVVSVQAVFTSSLLVPIHPVRAQQCVSRGVAEASLLKQIADQAKKQPRPRFKPPAD